MGDTNGGTPNGTEAQWVNRGTMGDILENRRDVTRRDET
jgi:hypothetical protein